ncbi:hypothetical protein EK0264_03080 [Epidermidibacterium keratini]|uniref:Lipoprotein LpqH n=1 Tax=Epidermidibacterium keratini TaxID=1891644 RepID=A0A7L4YKM7_9ACTN|nr:hypothetical protein [Epidermidibacterium keratini]QHB99368.1 hypothetical protein EK0264_03080 [Epidermidibacterium keratini]
MTRTLTRTAVALTAALGLALAGCSSDETTDSSSGQQTTQTQSSEPSSDEATGEQSDEVNEGSGSGPGSIDVTIDGTPSPLEWDAPLCTDLGGSMLLSSATEDGGVIDVQLNGTEVSVVNLTLPGEPMLTNFGDFTANISDGIYELSGPVQDDPYAPQVTYQLDLSVTCPS